VTVAVPLDAASPPRAPRKGRGEVAWVAPLLVGIIVLVIGLKLIDAVPIGGIFDDAAYVILAKSIATGQGYRWLNVPGAPVATHFPPGYPVVLAALWKIFPRFPANVLLFKVANATFLSAAAAGVAVFARRRLGFSPAACVVLTLAGALAVPMLYLSTQVLSEPLFLALLVPTLLFAERVVEGDGPASKIILLGLIVGLLTLVRTQGIAVAGAVGLLLLSRGRVRHALMFGAVAFAVMLPWQLWMRAHPYPASAVVGGNYEPYIAWLAKGYRSDGLAVAWSTLFGAGREIAAMLAMYTARSTPVWTHYVAAAAVVLLAIRGFFPFWRRARVTSVFLVLYLVIVLLWPWASSRFVWGIWPLVILLVAAGVADAAAANPVSFAPRAARWATLASAALLGAGYVRVNALGYQYRWWSSISRQNANALRPLIQWARERTSPTTVIAAELEPAVYLYADRKAVPEINFTVGDSFRPSTAAERADDLRAILATYHVDAVALISVDSLRAAMWSMSKGNNPELLPGDSLTNGRIYAPAHR
jgi:hypothetical protein